MPIEYRTSLELDRVYARWWGEIDIEQFRQNFATYLADRNYRAGRLELIDLSQVTHVDLDFQRVQVMLRQVNEQMPGTRLHTKSVVWAPEDETYATGRMYQQLADYAGGVAVDIFRRETSALNACGLPFKSIRELLNNGNFVPPDPG